MNQKVAILMATYNGEKYISEQINSILRQTYEDWVLYISDDGSDDKTIQIIEAYIKKYQSKIKLINVGGRRGAKDNFTYLIHQIEEYSYYMFCDQDDVWLENKIEKELELMLILEKKNGVEKPILVFSDMMVVNESLDVIDNSFLHYSNLTWEDNDLFVRYVIHNYTAGCCMLCNKRLIELSAPIPQKITMHDYWISLIAASMGVIEFIDQPLNLYRQHDNNAIGAQKWIITNLRKSFNPNNIEKLRKEKKEKLDMVMVIYDRYGYILSDDSKNTIRYICNFLKNSSIVMIWQINRKYKLNLAMNYFFMLLLKI